MFRKRVGRCPLSPGAGRSVGRGAGRTATPPTATPPTAAAGSRRRAQGHSSAPCRALSLRQLSYPTRLGFSVWSSGEEEFPFMSRVSHQPGALCALGIE